MTKLLSSAHLFFCCLLFGATSTLILAGETETSLRKLGKKSGKKDKKSESGGDGGNLCGRYQKLMIRIVNLTRNQPFSPFFVAIHNDKAEPLFKYQVGASPGLELLAEDGDPSLLITEYQRMKGVLVAKPSTAGAPPGLVDRQLLIDIDDVSRRYPYVTIASMFVNSNDGFCAINGERVKPGDVFLLDGLDAGTERNDEDCSNIPGPGCPSGSGNGSIDEPEGFNFVRVHGGFHGIGNLLPTEAYDWRNPMIRAEVFCMDVHQY